MIFSPVPAPADPIKLWIPTRFRADHHGIGQAGFSAVPIYHPHFYSNQDNIMFQSVKDDAHIIRSC